MKRKVEQPINDNNKVKLKKSYHTNYGFFIKDEYPSLSASKQDHRFFKLLQSGTLASDFFEKSPTESKDYIVQVL